jgi:putative phosphotransacetylase
MNLFYNKPIPIGVSVSHIHITQKHLDTIYGNNYRLTPRKSLTQKNQFAAEETVTLKTEKGKLTNVRILGPVRPWTQAELSKTDAIKLGLNPPVRESGNHKDTPGIIIAGPKGEIKINGGVILAMRHIHMDPQDAANFDVQNGDTVQILCGKERKLLFDEVLVRVNKDYRLDFHIDTDEANAACATTGDTGYLVKFSPVMNRGEEKDKKNTLLTESDVLTIIKKGESLKLTKDTIITPLALDLARKHNLL